MVYTTLFTAMDHAWKSKFLLWNYKIGLDAAARGGNDRRAELQTARISQTILRKNIASSKIVNFRIPYGDMRNVKNDLMLFRMLVFF